MQNLVQQLNYINQVNKIQVCKQVKYGDLEWYMTREKMTREKISHSHRHEQTK